MNKSKLPVTTDFILANICQLHHARAHQLLEGIGLYRGQPPVLRVLWEREGLTQTELAGTLKITPATMTKMLQRMEKAGFVQRRSDETDQRVTRVYLTQAGREVQGALEGIWRQMDADTFANFTPEERELLHRFLLQVRENLIRATGEKPWD